MSGVFFSESDRCFFLHKYVPFLYIVGVSGFKRQSLIGSAGIPSEIVPRAMRLNGSVELFRGTRSHFISVPACFIVHEEKGRGTVVSMPLTPA